MLPLLEFTLIDEVCHCVITEFWQTQPMSLVLLLLAAAGAAYLLLT